VHLVKNKELLEMSIYGEGNDKEKIIALVSKYRLQNTIIFEKYDPLWWRFFNQAISLISMSYYEGSPNVVLEAMAGKCPLIVSDIEEHREILSDNSAIFVDKNDAVLLAKYIDDILTDQIDVKKKSENAFNDIQRFTIENTANDYEKVYKEVFKCVE